MISPNKLFAARLRRNWSRKQLAKASGYGVSYIGHLERGSRGAVKHETLTRLADALGVEVKDLTK